jgi:hypothetical protein
VWSPVIDFIKGLGEPEKRKYKVSIYKTILIDEYEVEAVSRNEAMDLIEDIEYDFDTVMSAELI